MALGNVCLWERGWIVEDVCYNLRLQMTVYQYPYTIRDDDVALGGELQGKPRSSSGGRPKPGELNVDNACTSTFHALQCIYLHIDLQSASVEPLAHVVSNDKPLSHTSKPSPNASLARLTVLRLEQHRDLSSTDDLQHFPAVAQWHPPPQIVLQEQ